MSAFSFPSSVVIRNRHINCAQSDFVCPLSAPTLKTSRPSSTKHSTVLQAVSTDNSAVSLTAAIEKDIRVGNIRAAVSNLEAAVDKQTHSNQPVANYHAIHQLIVVADEKRQWELAIRTFNALEKSGLFAARSTSSILFNSLCRAGRFKEVEAVINRLWDRTIILYNGMERRLEMRQQARRVPDEKMILRVANSAVDNGKPELACKLIIQMENNGIMPSIFIISVLIKAYGRLRHTDGITNVLSRLNRRNLEPDLIVFNSAIDAYMRCGEKAMASQVLQEIFRRRLSPNSRSYNPILRSLASAGKLQEALAIREDMIRRGVVPCLHSYNALIHASVKSKEWTTAASFLNEAIATVEENSRDRRNKVRNYKDLCVGFTSVISGIAMEDKIDDALELLQNLSDRVQKAGLNAEMEIEIGIALTSILSALLKRGEVVRAWTIFRTIRQQFKVRLPPDTYNAAIRGLARQGDALSIDAARRVFDEMVQVFGDESNNDPRLKKHRKNMTSSNTPYVTIEAKTEDFVRAYNSMMDGYVRCGDTVSAEALLDEMLAEDIMPSAISFTTLINGYGKELDMMSAKRIFKRMRQSGVSPDRITMNAFIGACVRVGDLDLALRVFEEMQKVGGRLSPDLITFSAIIAGHVRNGDSTAAWDAYEEMKAMGIVPNERMLDRMMATFVSPELKPSKMDVFELDMDILGDTEGDDEVCIDSSEVDELVGDKTDLIHQDLAIGGLSSEGWTSKRALQLLKDMEQCKCSEMNKRRWRRAIQSVWGT